MKQKKKAFLLRKMERKDGGEKDTMKDEDEKRVMHQSVAGITERVHGAKQHRALRPHPQICRVLSRRPTMMRLIETISKNTLFTKWIC